MSRFFFSFSFRRFPLHIHSFSVAHSVHRHKLTKWSPYFRELFRLNYDGSHTEIVLHDIAGETLHAIIDYYCNGRSTKITADNISAVMAAASDFELTQLEKFCCNRTEEPKVNFSECVDWLIAPIGKRAALKVGRAMRVICENFEDFPIDELVNIDEKNFGMILATTPIPVAESIIFDRLKQWVEHDEVVRSASMASLAPFIQLQFLTPQVNCPCYDSPTVNILLFEIVVLFGWFSCSSFCVTRLRHFMWNTAAHGWYHASIICDRRYLCIGFQLGNMKCTPPYGCEQIKLIFVSSSSRKTHCTNFVRFHSA